MENRYPDAEVIVDKLKGRARLEPWEPVGIAPQQHYHRFPDGLSLCLTVDILSKEYLEEIFKILKIKDHAGDEAEKWFWHLSINRKGESSPSAEEIDFWRSAFFEAKPDIEVPGMITGINSRHFFWLFK